MQLDRLEHRPELVIPVRAIPEHAEIKIDLGVGANDDPEFLRAHFGGVGVTADGDVSPEAACPRGPPLLSS